MAIYDEEMECRVSILFDKIKDQCKDSYDLFNNNKHEWRDEGVGKIYNGHTISEILCVYENIDRYEYLVRENFKLLLRSSELYEDGRGLHRAWRKLLFAEESVKNLRSTIRDERLGKIFDK